MTVAELIKKMVVYSEGNLHDIAHFLKVYAYAKTIGECEHLDKDTQLVLEIAAVLHDIACPLYREKYGSTDGKYQEREGAVLAADFLEGTGFSEALVRWVSYLVGHHRTLTQIEGMDYQILIEADYLVNVDESHYDKDNIRNMYEKVFRTGTGKELLQNIYLCNPSLI